MLPVVNGICIVNCPGAPLPPVKLYVPVVNVSLQEFCELSPCVRIRLPATALTPSKVNVPQDRYLAGLAVVGKAAALKDVGAIERSRRKGASAAAVVTPVSHAVMPREGKRW